MVRGGVCFDFVLSSNSVKDSELWTDKQGGMEP